MKVCLALTFFCLALIARSQTANSSSCQFTINSTSFDLCQYAVDGATYTTGTDVDGTLTFSVGSATTSSCNGNQDVWAVLKDESGECHDVATEAPIITLQDPTNPNSGGLKITFPVYQSQSDANSYQLQISLNCDEDYNLDGRYIMVPFSLDTITDNTASNLTTISLWSSSGYGCAKPACSITQLKSPNGLDYIGYNLCPLDKTVFNIPDTFGGYLSVTLGIEPAVESCEESEDDTSDIIIGFGNYYNDGTCTEALTPPLTYTAIDSSELGQGVQIVSSDNNMQVNLLCDSAQTNLSQTNFTMVLSTGAGEQMTFNLTGYSAVACPISTTVIPLLY